MENYLIPIARKEDAPLNSLVIYNMTGGIYYVKREDLLNFVNYYLYCFDEQSHFTCDLALAERHAVLFDLDFKFENEYDNRAVFSYMHEYLYPCLKSFFNPSRCFSVILAVRPCGGIHVHLPEFEMTHDDYILLCIQMQMHLNKRFDSYSVKLDIILNFNLSKSSKVGTIPYKPVYLCYFENENTSLELPLFDEENFKSKSKTFRQFFKYKNLNLHTVFREILPFNFKMAVEKTYFYMMPVVAKDKLLPVCYDTDIGANCQQNYRQVATFTYRDCEKLSIFKSVNLNFKAINYQKACRFIHSNGIRISDFESENHAFRQWLRRSQSNDSVTTGIFREIDRVLIEDNTSLRGRPDPIKIIMEYDDGVHFLPMYYALCNHKKVKSSELIPLLKTANVSDVLLDKMRPIDDGIVDLICKDFSVNTVLYCGSNLTQKSTTFGEKINSVVRQMTNVIEACLTADNLMDVIYRIMERYNPVIVAQLKNSCKKPVKYMWNVVQEQWQEVQGDNQIKNNIIKILTHIRKELSASAVAPSILDHCKIGLSTEILANIESESNMNRKQISMDQHKWHVRVGDAGVCCVLSGHVGSTVPEFYLSNLSMGVRLTARQLTDLRNDTYLLKVYETITSAEFFDRYLENLYLDLTDDFHDTLVQTAREFDVYDERNPYLKSILNFYEHLCKYMSFEYDVFMYMLDVLSSIFIATNYCRHFFIFQGVTGNGKSKFFEMISKVFGSYSQSIRNVNLQSMKSLNAQPEMAASLFNKRVILIEELFGKIDENLIKEITGNSQTSFRFLYENNTGGCPTAKIFATTNSAPVCTGTEAFRSRVVTFPFNSTFVVYDRNVNTSDQVENDRYRLNRSDAVTNDSYVGFFVLIYIHLFRNIDYKDGYLHLRPEPVILTEFKEHYLQMTSLYMQFKQYADIQVIEGESTTRSDVITAIHTFLVETKRVGTVRDSELLTKFEMEFKDHKQCEEVDDYFSFCGIEEDEEDEPLAKRRKMTCITIYRDISIKSIKKR